MPKYALKRVKYAQNMHNQKTIYNKNLTFILIIISNNLLLIIYNL